jgi:pentatricopeptide repeat protein
MTLWEPYPLQLRPQHRGAAGAGPVERTVYLPKCIVLLSGYPYLAAFREYLTQLNMMSKTGEMTLPIERYITNFCAEIPAPPPGSFEVQTTILDSVIKMWSLPHNLPIAWVSLPFSHLFECLDIDNIILVWHCMTLERQVLITSTQISLLTTASEIFLSLLFPMRWSHAYIPVLPHFLIPILSAPMPFLCGINKTNLADALYDLSRDCVLVDLDKNTVTLGPDTPALPPLPPYQESVLRAQLEENAGMVFREARSLTKTDDYSDSGQNLHGHVKLMAEAMWESKLMLYDEAFHLMYTPEQLRKNLLNGNDSSGMEGDSSRDLSISTVVIRTNREKETRKQSAWDAVQEAFLDSFVYLLRNYRHYLVFPSKHNEGVFGGAGFRSKEFIEAQRYDMREFLQQFVGTQMFDNFVTKRLYGSGEADVSFFDMAVNRFLKSAGLLSNVDLAGRIKGGYKAVTEKEQLSSRNQSNRRKNATKAKSAIQKLDPLLQSARVHRKLKTIVPPEPTGDGLPDNVHELVAGKAQISTPKTPSNTIFDADDDASVHSIRSTGTSDSRKSTPLRPMTAAEKAAEIINSKKGKSYTYPVFPSELNPKLFGNPRPLPAAVIAEFDRQRKDAAQFRRKSHRKKNESTTSGTQHIQRAHAATDSVTPPSPEVATFTVFYMAFTGLVGKELMDMAHTQRSSKTILSTYVPSAGVSANATDDETASVDGRSEEEDPIDEVERQGVAEMKTARPIRGMFGEDGEEDASSIPSTINGTANKSKKTLDTAREEYSAVVEAKKENGSSKGGSQAFDEASVKSSDSKPKERFRDKLSDLEIEEAKAKGRAQLGLAFEMLVMMKKRALQADPEAYQVLIDACGRVGDTKRATELLAKMHEDGIVADGTVYACLVSAFSAESAWKDKSEEELPEWANSTAVDMDWNKLQKRSFLDRVISQVVDLDDEEDEENEDGMTAYQKLRKRLANRNKDQSKGLSKAEDREGMEFFVTEMVERQIALGENLLEIVFPDISIDTENEICPRCNFTLSDDDVVNGWTPGNLNDYTTSCPNCTQRFVPHFCVQCSSPTFVGSRGPETPLMCERLSPWVLQKEIRSVMSDVGGTGNLLSPEWREKEYKNAVLWWNLVLSCMRYRLPFSFLLQGSFEQNLIAPMPED